MFKKKIEELSKLLGFDIEVNSDESCALEYENLIITLQYRREQNDVLIFAPVTDPDKISNLPESALRTALKLSFKGSGTGMNYLGMVEGHLILSNYISIDNITAEELANKIYLFTTSAEDVSKAITASIEHHG